MGQREPIRELLNGLLGRGPIERHQRRRAARRAHEIGAPALRIDQHGFDLVTASVDGLFGAVDGHDYRAGVGLMMATRTRGILVTWHVSATAKESAKIGAQGGRSRLRLLGAGSEKF